MGNWGRAEIEGGGGGESREDGGTWGRRGPRAGRDIVGSEVLDCEEGPGKEMSKENKSVSHHRGMSGGQQREEPSRDSIAEVGAMAGDLEMAWRSDGCSTEAGPMAPAAGEGRPAPLIRTRPPMGCAWGGDAPLPAPGGLPFSCLHGD